MVKIDTRRIELETVDGIWKALADVSSVRFLVTFSPSLMKERGWTRPEDLLERLADSGMKFWRIGEHGDFISTAAGELLRDVGSAGADFLAAGQLD
jgi:hypothetical protein